MHQDNYTADSGENTSYIPAIEQALADLIELNQWVGWRAISNPDFSKITKIPVNPRTNGNASVTAPTSWSSYTEALRAVERYNLAGIGFVLTAENGLTGIDLDNCIRPDDTLSPLAQHIVDQAASYTYVTPSGRGLRIMVRGHIRRSVAVPGLEVYCQKRYFTAGGDPWPGTPLEVRDGTAILAQLEGPLRRLAEAANAVKSAPSGGGNDILNREAFHLAREGGVDQNLALDVLLDAATPRRTQAEALETFNSGWSAGERGPGQREGRRNTTQDYFDALADAGYELKLNTQDDSVQINGARMTDVLRSNMLNGLRDRGLMSKAWAEDAINSMADQAQFHPIKDYLNELEWDGQDYIKMLVSYLKSDDPEWVELALRKWLIGAVGKVFDRRQNTMLVLAGPQNCGKSTLARWLNPLGKDYHVEAPIKPDNKDDLLLLIRNLTWEVGELGATIRKSDIEALKFFITLQDVTVRKPYGKVDIIKPASASFIGTINPTGSGFLADSTGNRRFVIVELTGIDWEYQKVVTAANLWAQAVALYKVGEPWTLTAEEAEKRDTKNEEHEIESPFAHYFFRVYELDPTNQEWKTSLEIITILEHFADMRLPQTRSFMELAMLMKKLGVKKGKPSTTGTGGKVSRVNAYQGIRILEEIEAKKPESEGNVVTTQVHKGIPGTDYVLVSTGLSTNLNRN